MIRALIIFFIAAIALSAERFEYTADWRFGTAGKVELHYQPSGAQLILKTVGFAHTLYEVDDRYSSEFNDAFCASTSFLHAEEGKKRLETRVLFNRLPGKAELVERDLAKDAVVKTQTIDVPPCVHDVVAGLARLRRMNAAPGQTLQLPISDGRKSVLVKIDAQQKESVQTPAGTFQTQRYEAFLFNGVLYRRKARLFIWISDDDRRVPVQIKIQLPFYLGSVTLQLTKEDKS